MFLCAGDVAKCGACDRTIKSPLSIFTLVKGYAVEFDCAMIHYKMF